MTRIRKIIIYPVKSLGGIEVKEAFAGIRGLEHDRRWMITDDRHKFITQREIPGMSIIRPVLANGEIYLSYKSEKSEPITEIDKKDIHKVKVWADTVEAYHVNTHVDRWLSDLLGQGVKLFKMTDDTLRSEKRNGGRVSLADRWPYLLLSESSITDLNSRLGRPTSPENFRPNIIVDHQIPFEEEGWKKFSVGGVVFNGQGPCGRCQMINIDQKTGEINDLVLNTLKSYRSLPGKIPMGLQASVEATGMIRVGDEIK